MRVQNFRITEFLKAQGVLLHKGWLKSFDFLVPEIKYVMEGQGDHYMRAPNS
jgi:hypothetical protein